MTVPDNSYRELRFTLEITTELDEGDEVDPTIAYVRDWLTDNQYDSVLIRYRFAPSGWEGGRVNSR